MDVDPNTQKYMRHGLYRFLSDGELPQDLQGFDAELTGRLVAMAGGDEKYVVTASIAARTITATELIKRYIDATLAKVHDKGLSIEQAVPALIPVLKIYNSYLEGSRRHLAELLLTPAAQLRVKQEDDGSTAAQVLEQYREKEDHAQNS